jgi:hypothetical protein
MRGGVTEYPMHSLPPSCPMRSAAQAVPAGRLRRGARHGAVAHAESGCQYSGIINLAWRGVARFEMRPLARAWALRLFFGLLFEPLVERLPLGVVVGWAGLETLV